MASEGADLVDVGGESTRPGSDPVSGDEEIRRVVPVVRALKGRAPAIPLSIDTTKAAVAEAAIEAGASLINDTSGLQDDPGIAGVAARSGAGLLLMHRKGPPKTMQEAPVYDDVVREIRAFLTLQAERAQRAGVPPEALLVDPGIGFGKTLEHNLEILRRLPELASLGFPVVVGPSRKSFLGKILDRPPEGRLEGTLAACVSAALAGAAMVRVHDVAPVRRALAIADAIRKGGSHAG